jgi:hypothetical protein
MKVIIENFGRLVPFILFLFSTIFFVTYTLKWLMSNKDSQQARKFMLYILFSAMGFLVSMIFAVFIMFENN